MGRERCAYARSVESPNFPSPTAAIIAFCAIACGDLSVKVICVLQPLDGLCASFFLAEAPLSFLNVLRYPLQACDVLYRLNNETEGGFFTCFGGERPGPFPLLYSGFFDR